VPLLQGLAGLATSAAHNLGLVYLRRWRALCGVLRLVRQHTALARWMQYAARQWAVADIFHRAYSPASRNTVQGHRVGCRLVRARVRLILRAWAIAGRKIAVRWRAIDRTAVRCHMCCAVSCKHRGSLFPEPFGLAAGSVTLPSSGGPPGTARKSRHGNSSTRRSLRSGRRGPSQRRHSEPGARR